jgi:hypothetical protein
MPVKLIEGIPEPKVTRISYITKPTKLIIKCGSTRYERVVPLRRKVVTSVYNRRTTAALHRALKAKVTCGTSRVPLATRRALAAREAKEAAERKIKSRWEQAVALDRHKASAAAECRREVCRRKGYNLVHAHNLYAVYEAEDKELYPEFLSSGREPGNAFFKDAYHAWRANILEARAYVDVDCESVS